MIRFSDSRHDDPDYPDPGGLFEPMKLIIWAEVKPRTGSRLAADFNGDGAADLAIVEDSAPTIMEPQLQVDYPSWRGQRWMDGPKKPR